MKDKTNNHYGHCVKLSQIGDKKSLSILLGYCFDERKEVRKVARTVIRKTKNKKLLKLIIDEKLNRVESPEHRFSILTVAVHIFRENYLYDYLCTAKALGVELTTDEFLKTLTINTLTEDEQFAIEKYVLEYNDLNFHLIKMIDSDHNTRILEKILDNIYAGSLNKVYAKILGTNKVFLANNQEIIRNIVHERNEGTMQFASYLDLSIEENQKELNSFQKMSLIYNVLKNSVWDIPKIEVHFFYVYVAKKVYDGETISDAEMAFIKEDIAKEMVGIHGENFATRLLLDWIIVLSRINYVYAESVLISIYKRTRLYTSKALDELVKIRSEYAYKEIISNILSTEDQQYRYGQCMKLVYSYPDRIESILEYVKVFDDSRLQRIIKEAGEKKGVWPIQTGSMALSDELGKYKCSILSPDTIISELLFKLAKQIKATKFYVAVGFSFKSGLKMLTPIYEEVLANSGEAELISGSLQYYNTGVKNTKIDKATAIYINDLIDQKLLQIYAYQENFYHGKFYYLSNEEVSYVIIGSSNISKTAFLNNRELDVIFEMNVNSKEDIDFAKWYTNIKDSCIHLPRLDTNQFDNFDWDSELDVYKAFVVKRLSTEEVSNRILELTDEDTKFRLSIWLDLNPSDIFSELGIASLKDYIVFLYPKKRLAVFESFTPGNAYYAFRYDDLEGLLNRVAELTKTEMILSNLLVNRGYHIQDKGKLKNKIRKLFNSEIEE